MIDIASEYHAIRQELAELDKPVDITKFDPLDYMLTQHRARAALGQRITPILDALAAGTEPPASVGKFRIMMLAARLS